ncbi:hypothetical protein GGR89_001238 [Sphingomonas trueperi]|uniref:Uncharacterized protein n=1 Tax=Sphingomonas trueperi TaxID=53317 RepID=A0A7X6BCR8_9SPHN|nr:hypothetical protein [Sphingomonas trueperi]
MSMKPGNRNLPRPFVNAAFRGSGPIERPTLTMRPSLTSTRASVSALLPRPSRTVTWSMTVLPSPVSASPVAHDASARPINAAIQRRRSMVPVDTGSERTDTWQPNASLVHVSSANEFPKKPSFSGQLQMAAFR